MDRNIGTSPAGQWKPAHKAISLFCVANASLTLAVKVISIRNGFRELNRSQPRYNSNEQGRQTCFLNPIRVKLTAEFLSRPRADFCPRGAQGTPVGAGDH